MNTRTWLVAALALTGVAATLTAPLAEATHVTYCKQNFDYPPVCCPHKYLVAQHVDPKDLAAGIRNTLRYCDFAP